MHVTPNPTFQKYAAEPAGRVHHGVVCIETSIRPTRTPLAHLS